MAAPGPDPVSSRRTWAGAGASRRRHACLQVVLVLLGAMGPSLVARAADDPAQVLRDQYRALAERLEQSHWGRPIQVQSAVRSNHLQGEIHAVVDHVFADVQRELGNPEHWCEVIQLHPNTKYCRVTTGPAGTQLQVRIGTSGPQKIDDAVLVSLTHRTQARLPGYDWLELFSREGPMGTSDYRIGLAALALPNARTFLHLTYSYTFNGIARLAMQTYLATLARDKVGFTIVGQADGKPVFIGGPRGHVERNTMRYFLAIESTLATMREPVSTRGEQRLQAWFDAAQRYPRQLHELERNAYLQMKRDEIERQQRLAENSDARETKP